MARKWVKFPHAEKAYVHDAAGLKKHWPRLHKGDCEPVPKDAAVLEAWRHYHAGDFAQAVEAGLAAGGSGMNAAVKAQVVYATYLEKNEKTKLALLEEAMEWGDARRAAAPKDPNAHYFFAFAAGRYGQGISVAKALAQGLGGKIRDALLTAIKLEAKHADAHIAYGSGPQQFAELWLPKVKREHPVIVLVHGGFVDGSPHDLYANVQARALQGGGMRDQIDA